MQVLSNIFNSLNVFNFLLSDTQWEEIHAQLCEILADDPVTAALTMSERHWMEFYRFYLHDFLRSVHQVTHHMAEKEYEVSI